jgi:hypothetical protein
MSHYSIEDIKLTKMEKLLWYNNIKKLMELNYKLNFDHFPSITTATDHEEFGRVYDYMVFIVQSKDIKDYAKFVDYTARNYKVRDDFFKDSAKNGYLNNRNTAQSFIMANEMKFLGDDKPFITMNYSTEFIETVSEMIEEQK